MGGGKKQASVMNDEPDVLDAEYVLQGVGVNVWRRVRRVRRVEWWFIFLGSHTAYYKQIVCHCGARALHRLLKHGRLSNWACLDNN